MLEKVLYETKPLSAWTTALLVASTFVLSGAAAATLLFLLEHI